MSGFAGFFGCPFLDLARLRQVHRLLSSRGGDGAHAVAWNAAFERSKSDMCHALLADRFATRDPLPAAALPMRNALGNIWIVFDGYLADTVALRRELQGRGIRFQSQTDAEVALYAYENWGTEAFSRLNGAFACAVLDLYTHKIYLARDRFGLRPLVWWSQPQQFAFASSVRALAAGLPTWSLSATGIDAYLAHGYLPAPLTLLEGVHLLEHGSLCEFDFKQGHTKISRFAEWQSNSAVNLDQRWQSMLGDYWRTDVETAVDLQPTAASIALAAYAGQRWPKQVMAVGVDHPQTAQLAEQLQLVWQPLQLSLNPAIDFTQWVSGLNLPIADPQWFGRWVQMRAVRPHARVLIGAGEEADWLLENTPHLQHFWHRRWERFLPTAWPVSAKIRATAWRPRYQLPWLGRYTQSQGLTPDLRCYLLGGRRLRKLSYTRAPLQLRHERLSAAALLQRSDWSHNLAEGYLHPLDGVCAAQGVEMRLPYLDVDLSRACLARSAKQRRDWLMQQLPAATVSRCQPHSRPIIPPPWRQWLQHDLADRLPILGGQLQTLTRQQLRASAIEALVIHSQHQPERYGRAVWQLCVLAEWLTQLQTFPTS